MQRGRRPPAPGDLPPYPRRTPTKPTRPDRHAASPEILAAARRLGPLPWSALGPAPGEDLPGCTGAAVAEVLDAAWEAWGRPDPLPVVVVGERAVSVVAGALSAGPRCAAASRWLVVGPGAARGALAGVVAVEEASVVLGPAVPGADPDEAPVPAPGAGPVAAVLAELPAGLPLAVVVAAAVLDSLPSDRYERRDHGWAEVRLAAAGEELAEVLVDAGAGYPGRPVGGPVAGAAGRVEDPVGARRWLRAARAVAADGLVLAVAGAPPPPGLPARTAVPGPDRGAGDGGRLCPKLHLAAWTMRGGTS